MKSVALCLALVASPSLAILEPIRAVHNGTGKPIMFLALGPTGCGKSTQERELVSLFNLRNDKLVKSPPKPCIVDGFIETDPGYRKNILDYLILNLGPSPSKEKVDQWVASAGPDVYDYFAKQYFGCRKDWGCHNEGNGGCEYIFDEMVNASLARGDNIMYESTGKRYPADKIELANGLYAEVGYDTVVGINSVDFCDLKDRNAKRATQSIMEFMAKPEDYSIAAPRLPDLTMLRSNVEGILKAMKVVIDCIGEPISKTCPAKIDELFVFSNEHWGFLPGVRVKAPETSIPETLKSLSKLKAEAKAMLEFMKPRNCAAGNFTIVI